MIEKQLYQYTVIVGSKPIGEVTKSVITVAERKISYRAISSEEPFFVVDKPTLVFERKNLEKVHYNFSNNQLERVVVVFEEENDKQAKRVLYRAITDKLRLEKEKLENKIKNIDLEIKGLVERYNNDEKGKK